MNIAAIKNKLRYVSFFIPFRFQLILLSIALLLCGYWLKKTRALPDTSYTAITYLFISVVLFFMAAVFIISFLTTVIPWLLFLFDKKKGKSVVKIKTASKNSITEKQAIEINISSILKPIFGYIRLRLNYDDKNISSKFELINTDHSKQFISTNHKGVYNWLLPEIKEYKVSDAIIYFEDMFQLFSFAASIPAQDNFFTQPSDSLLSEMKVRPKKTEDTSTRIDEMRKVEGEFLNYKNFEGNDDVRRIVWKIYAKNKELVVRIPETNDPYASHVYFYASFHNQISTELYNNINNAFLNYYKTVVWNAYNQLSKQNVLIKYIPDQQSKKTFADDELQKIKYSISTSNWQTDKNLQDYFKKDEASILCISSLTDATQIKHIVERSSKELVIVFAQLSNSIKRMMVNDWIKWMFVKPDKDGLEKLRLTWNLSSLKRNILDNERSIKQLLENSDCEKIIV